MKSGNRGPGSPNGRRRAFRPINEGLEDRRLLTTIDLGNIQGTTVAGPLGVEAVGATSGEASGYTVTDVGNINGSGYDSYVVSAPAIVPSPAAPDPSIPANVAGAGNGKAYLIFGSRQVNTSFPVDFLTLSNTQRAADLAQLGTTGTTTTSTGLSQVNPTVTQPTGTSSQPIAGFNFDGLTLQTPSNLKSALGFSVSPLGDINGDGVDDFAISAPNDTGGGRVFVIYGGTNLTNQVATAKTLSLETTSGTTNANFPTKLVSFAIPSTSALASTTNEVGYSVAGIGNYFNTTIGRDLAIGVPGLNGGTGAAYAVSGAYINSLATGTSVDLSTVGTTTASLAGIAYTGITAGDRVGESVGTAGSFDNAKSGNLPLDSLLIGAPEIGKVYLVYSVQLTAANSNLGTTQSLTTLGAVQNTNPVTTPLQGVVFQDLTTADRFGFSLAGIGDFNNDGVGDFLVGAPGYNRQTGYAEVFEGIAGDSSITSTRLNGVINVQPASPTKAAVPPTSLTPPANPTRLSEVTYFGQTLFNLAGYSVAGSAHLSFSTATGSQPANDILIGEPGYLGTQGDAFLVPGALSDITLATGTTGYTALDGTVQLLSAIVTATTSASGLQFIRTAPAPSAASGVPNESNLGVSYFGTSVSARNPVVDINTLSTSLDGDTVPDLFFSAPYSSLSNSTLPYTPSSRTNAGVTFAVEGSLIGGTGSGSTGGGGTTTPTGPGTVITNTALSLLTPPIFTGDNFGLAVPTVSSLSHVTSYQPLPVQLAYEQFRPAQGFRAREEAYHHPGRGSSHQAPRGTERTVEYLGRDGLNKYLKNPVYSSHVYHTSIFKKGKAISFSHRIKVIPRSEQTQTFQA